MTDPAVVRRGPLPSVQGERVPARVHRLWPKRVRDICTCYVCKRVYSRTHFAYRCERWHWGD